ncbi:MAG: DUF3380 domain-containing protein [Alphaproteobacteria bacterium]|jgi:hypothetical protein|nr:DUF3380 domain-containing protein [Alphaproteobacteria bacterium]
MDAGLVARAAAALDCDAAAVAAVMEIESSGSGMVAPGRCTVRFEGATFHRLTGGRFDAVRPDLSMPSWRDNAGFVRGGLAEWERVEQAADLDHEGAYKSASYGLFQIMGFNYPIAGYAAVDDFVNEMNAGEAGQVTAFVRFLCGAGLDAPLRRQDWRTFARGYNGPGQVDTYADKLAAAYARHAGR